ncbi:MAG TPA: F0F1 ATP synthase subunit delta [Candidatus Woesebacteria bacterium]|nr:F0F1 ATP synthase subunit delta [Candidatus Woesebacteria bacterium]
MQKFTKIQVKVTTATKLDSDQARILRQLLTAKLGNKFEIIETIDATNLGGIKIRIGDQEFDLTIAGQLKKIQTQTPIVEITTAAKLTTEQKSKLERGLEKRFGGEYLIKEVIDPSLIGGLSIRINDQEFDGTIKTKLQKLHQQIKNNL